jgi:dUTP pyrophosphatase
MSAKFEVAKGYSNINLPVRKTVESAGYDFEVAEDIVIPGYINCFNKLAINNSKLMLEPQDLDTVANITKEFGRPTLIPTGIKCKLDSGTYLELSVRSSCPLKYWIILANGNGIIDADYYGNQDNDGAIFFQVINLSPFSIQLRKGDIIGQGIIKQYLKTEDDIATATRIGGFGSTNG